MVPGNINSTASLGSNLLLYETNAKPLVIFRHLLDDLHLQPGPASQPMSLGNDEQKIWQVLSEGQEKTIDEISQETKLSTAHVQGMISVLEIKGLVYTSLGKVFAAELPCNTP